jgi:diadenosine tetraphosphatase ApaH/serine/threonine PP2A family protein phosphatase
VKDVDGMLFVNDGSVGKRKDGDRRAQYAIFDLGTELKVTIQRVEYDVAAAAAAVRASDLHDRFAELLETGGG